MSIGPPRCCSPCPPRGPCCQLTFLRFAHTPSHFFSSPHCFWPSKTSAREIEKLLFSSQCSYGFGPISTEASPLASGRLPFTPPKPCCGSNLGPRLVPNPSRWKLKVPLDLRDQPFLRGHCGWGPA